MKTSRQTLATFGQDRRLVALLAVFVLLGFAYSFAIPIFETPDEVHHFATVQHIAQTGRLPQVGSPGSDLWEQEGFQAPLYYVLGAAATFWIDTSDIRQQAVPQPKANFGDATLPGKKNAFIHGPDQAFPYHGTTLAVRITRWLSVLFGAGTLALTWIAARFVFRNSQNSRSKSPGSSENGDLGWLALLCAGLLAFIPQFIFIHAATSNDPAITFTSTLTLVMLLWLAQEGVTLRRAALLGFVIGLMGLSKMVGSVLAVVAILLLLILSRRLDATAVAIAVAAAVSGWWYVRNQILYGDPLALGAFLKFTEANLEIGALPPLDFVWGEFRLLRFTTWGLFGQMSVLMQPTGIYSILDVLTLVAGIGFIAAIVTSLIRAIRQGGWRAGLGSFKANRAVFITLVWFGVVMAAGVRWFLAEGLQGRLIFPGLPAGIILMIYGLRFLLGRIPVKALTLALVLPMLALAVYVIPANLLPAYAPPPLVAQMPAEAIPVGATFADEIKLDGYTFAQRGDLIYFTFYWETLRTPPVDYTVAIRLVRADGSFWLDYVNYPGMGTSMPTTWKSGEVRRDEYIFDMTRFPPAQEPLRLIVGYFDPRSRSMTPVSDWQDVREAGWATLRQVDLNP